MGKRKKKDSASGVAVCPPPPAPATEEGSLPFLENEILACHPEAATQLEATDSRAGVASAAPLPPLAEIDLLDVLEAEMAQPDSNTVAAPAAAPLHPAEIEFELVEDDGNDDDARAHMAPSRLAAAVSRPSSHAARRRPRRPIHRSSSPTKLPVWLFDLLTLYHKINGLMTTRRYVKHQGEPWKLLNQALRLVQECRDAYEKTTLPPSVVLVQCAIARIYNRLTFVYATLDMLHKKPPWWSDPPLDLLNDMMDDVIRLQGKVLAAMNEQFQKVRNARRREKGGVEILE